MSRHRTAFKPVDPTYARYVELRANVYGNMEEDDLPEDLLTEFHKVRDAWKKRTLLAHHRPTCCEAAQRYPAVTFDVSQPEGEEPTGRWVAHLHSGLTQEFALLFADDDHGISWFRNIPEAKVCPYCGTALPKMVYVPNKPDICHTSGHDYCDNCGERLRGCECLPPSAAFEPV